MANQRRTWAREFFGPLWAWELTGAGLLLSVSAYELVKMGVSNSVAFVLLIVGMAVALAAMTYLVA